jgi:hypothetical protein
MLATLLQQWARRYLRVTRPPRYTPHDRARIRAFFAHGVDKFHLSKAIDALPSLIQLSLFLFFAGLLIYLFNVNHTIFRIVAWWVGVSAAVYMLITLMPIIWHESPYYTPLSSITWSLYTNVSYLIFLFSRHLCCCYGATSKRVIELNRHYRGQVFQYIEAIGEKTIQTQVLDIDGCVLKWTWDALVDDHELGRFFQCILGLRSSKVVKDPHHVIQTLGTSQLSPSLAAFFHRTWSSNLISEEDKIQRLVVCVKVADAIRLLDAIWQILDGVLDDDQLGVLESTEMGHLLRSEGNASVQEPRLCAQSIVGCIIANAQIHDHRYTALAADQLGKSEDELRTCYPEHESVLLANLVYVTRQFHRTHTILLNGLPFNPDWPLSRVISRFTRSLSKFDIRKAHPVLQYEFCVLWNELVRSESDGLANHILTGFLHLYLALHLGIHAAPTASSASTADDDNSPSYLFCNPQGHRPKISERGDTMGTAATTHPTFPTTSYDATLTVDLPVQHSANTSSHHADDSLAHEPVSSFSTSTTSTTARSGVTPLTVSAPGAKHTTTISTPGVHVDAEDQNNRIRHELSDHANQSEPPLPNTVGTALQPQNPDSSKNSS